MKNSIRFTIGHLGYLLIGFMTLCALFVQDDKIGIVILIVGSIFLIDYVAYFEKNMEPRNTLDTLNLFYLLCFSFLVF